MLLAIYETDIEAIKNEHFLRTSNHFFQLVLSTQDDFTEFYYERKLIVSIFRFDS